MTFIVPAVLCGGAGTRLWPASRESMPKQFIKFLGKSSPFQSAVQTVANPALFARPIVITSSDSRFVAAEQLAEIRVEADILLEPERRDSAAAVAAAALQAASRDPKAIVLALTADHIIRDYEVFNVVAKAAAESAKAGFIVTLGVVPKQPFVGSFISPASRIPSTAALHVARFFDNQNPQTAQDFIASGVLYNSGNLFFRADIFLSELEDLEPELLNCVKGAFQRARRDLAFIRLDDSFRGVPQMSIDKALVERSDRSAVLPVNYEWSDIASWGALWDASPHDANGNVVRGNVEVTGAQNNLVISDDVLTTVVGLDNIVVVTEPDAVLVTSRERSSEVKDLVSKLRRNSHREADEHLRIYRPWGWYQRVDLGPRFQVKRIMVKPGGRLSLQKHFHRAEHWVVVAGTAEATLGDQVMTIHENEAVYVPIGCIHRLANAGKIPLELIEVQVGSYTGEDDIVRLEDIYGR